MPKPRTKRGAVREERKRKHSETANPNAHEHKRQRRDDDEGDYNNTNDYSTHYHNANGEEEDYGSSHHQGGGGPGEREFFGMLADDEQEYFRRADEMLELNQFPTPEDRDMFLQSVYREARGKELKIASSQSCSRLMERLIQLASTSQKKQLFEAFGGHFLSLVQHRFASHCCEALFLRSAGVVTQELAGFTGFVMDTKGADVEEQQPEASMEHLFLATLDELEGSLGYLITDRFASHTLRVLLLVLSGMPLEEQSSRTLLKSKRKEKITVVGSTEADAQNRGKRAVPASFIMAANKIMRDSVEGMDATAIQVLAKHPIGNPILQLILELDLTLNKGEAKAKGEDGNAGDASPSLLQKLLPGAPKSLSDGSSAASEFVNGMIYDQIGSRLIETLVTHAPGKIFKALNQNIFLPRIQGYVRNDISCYPAIRVLQRLGKDDLAKAVDQIAPTVPQLVSKARYNVLSTLFERCAARNINDEIKKLMKGLKEGCGSQPADLVMTLCSLSASEEEEQKKKKDVQQVTKNQYAVQSHGAKLLTTLLSIPGPSKAVHESILALPSDLVLRLANTSLPTVTVLTTAIATPSSNSVFQKGLVNTLMPHIADLATSQYGHNLINAIAEIPSKGKDWSIPQHIKDKVMTALASHEPQLRESWMGRSVWRTWKGDMWKTRRFDWKNWMKELDEIKAPAAAAPKNKGEVKANGEKKTAKEEEAEEDAEQKDEKTDEVAEDVNGNGNGNDEAAAVRKEKKDKKDKKAKKEKKEKKKKAEEEAGEGGEAQEKKKKRKEKKKKSKDGDVEMADAEE
ncbi:ARM repeat-containing protein [Trichoderma citrinoviride]|uniref:Nucleolar protein 9 n=1 Tax=Trichoderma citrinoviride TaxID=58853 RepID=A0A2T4AY11_9HYPO|nr:ARM repeat-containing protein [Trichoderma citrinoviride]PTB61965.1 ARM repeat-containing protein [Trichoderma citrinoviride]